MVVALYRQLVGEEGVDAYVGLISGANCLAAAPVAEGRGRVLTVFLATPPGNSWTAT